MPIVAYNPAVMSEMETPTLTFWPSSVPVMVTVIYFLLRRGGEASRAPVPVGDGEHALDAWRAALATPAALLAHGLLLAAFVFHAWTWFEVMEYASRKTSNSGSSSRIRRL